MRREHTILLAIFLTAALLRIVGFGWGVPKDGRPYSLNTDEQNTTRSLSNMRPGELNFDPGYYDNPAFYYYQCGVLFGAASAVGYLPFNTDRAFYHRNPDIFARFFYLARGLSLVYALATIILVYYVGRYVVNGTVALFAAAVFAIVPTHIVNSRMMMPESAQVFWITLALWGAFVAADRPTRRSSLLLGLALGAAVATKLTSLPLLIWLPIVHLVRRRQDGESVWARLDYPALVGAAVVVVFLATNPYFFGARSLRESHIFNSTTDWLPPKSVTALSVYPRMFYSMGPFVLAAALAGFFAALGRRDRYDWILVGALVPLIGFFTFYSWLAIDRRIIPMLPLCVLLLSRWLGSLLSSPRWNTAASWVVTATLLGTGLYGALTALRFTMPDRAQLSARWLCDHLPDSTTIGFSTYYFFFGPDEIGHDYLLLASQSHREAGLRPVTPFRLTMDSVWTAKPEVVIVPRSGWYIDPYFGVVDTMLVKSGEYRHLATITQPRPGLEWIPPHFGEEYLFFHTPIDILGRKDFVLETE